MGVSIWRDLPFWALRAVLGVGVEKGDVVDACEYVEDVLDNVEEAWERETRDPDEVACVARVVGGCCDAARPMIVWLSHGRNMVG